jgi:hypothetical protein
VCIPKRFYKKGARGEIALRVGVRIASFKLWKQRSSEMPHVPSQPQVKRNGHQTRADIKKSARPAIARDDLRTAFAGDKNRGPAGKISKPGKATHQKSRRLRVGDGKEPVR